METGKVHVAGTFNQLSSIRFPMVHPQFYLYLAMTELTEGQRKVGLNLHYLETGQKVLHVEQNIQSRGPLDVIEMNLCFNSIKFAEEGNIECTLSVDDEEAMTRVLKIRKVEPPHGSQMGNRPPH
jgi:hypothetical protein